MFINTMWIMWETIYNPLLSAYYPVDISEYNLKKISSKISFNAVLITNLGTPHFINIHNFVDKCG